MANYYQYGSSQFKLPKAAATRLVEIIEEWRCNEDSYSATLDCEYGGDVGCEEEAIPENDTDSLVWVFSMESFASDFVADALSLVLKEHQLDLMFTFRTALGCSKARLDAFGGTCWFVSREGAQCLNEEKWIEQTEKAVIRKRRFGK